MIVKRSAWKLLLFRAFFPGPLRRRFVPVVIFLAVDVAVPREARDLAVESVPALAALQTGGMPSPVDRLQVEPVGDFGAAAGTHGRIVGADRRCGRRVRRLDRFDLRYVVVERGRRPLDLRPAHVRPVRPTYVRVMRSAYVRAARRLVVVVGRSAA